ncbi:MAG TPA: MATE family efflux transporter, partial [Methylophilaceae bacterium]|nr:MATE family efflux transporter [Methylophilaceae bacterium]
DRVSPAFSHARAVLREGWRTGRDYLAAWQFQWLGAQGIFMLGAGVVGTEAVGAARATQNIVGPINILFLAMDNLVPVAAARRYGASGLPGLAHYLWRITFWGTLLLAPLLLTLSLFSTRIMHLLYGEQYLAYASLVYWQASYVFIQFYLRQTFFFLRTVKATGVILRSGILMSIISVSVTALTVQRYQEIGLMMALVCGVLAGLAYSVFAARRLNNKLKLDDAPAASMPGNNSINMGSKA